MKKLYIDYNPFFVRAAMTENGELTEFGVERVARRSKVGNIYKGKVENVLAGMHAAFVNIGLPRNGFLYVGDGEGGQPVRKLSAGDIIMCQVEKEEFNLKGARLTTDVTLPGSYVVLMPRGGVHGVSRKIEDAELRASLEELVASVCPEDMGFIVRSAANGAAEKDIIDEVEYLVSLWRRVERDYAGAQAGSVVFREAHLVERLVRDGYCDGADSVVVNDSSLADTLRSRLRRARVEAYDGAENIFRHFGLDAQIDKLSDRRVDMAGGAYLVIDRTEALTVIDVNTGRYVGVKDLEDTVFRTNMLAATEIARQLRVRNISGMVIIDFIDMADENHRAEVMETLCAELRKDKRKTTAVGMTGLGLVELTRKRTSLPADSFMLEPCRGCSGGYVVSRTHLAIKLRDAMVDFTLAHRFESMIVRAHPDVCEEAFSSRVMARELAGVWRGRRVYLIPDAAMERHAHVIEGSNDKVLTLPAEAMLLC